MSGLASSAIRGAGTSIGGRRRRGTQRNAFRQKFNKSIGDISRNFGKLTRKNRFSRSNRRSNSRSKNFFGWGGNRR
jgi:hypothetical protein